MPWAFRPAPHGNSTSTTVMRRQGDVQWLPPQVPAVRTADAPIPQLFYTQICRRPCLFFLLLLPMSAALVIPVYVDAVTIVMGAARNRIRKMMHKRKEVRANAASTMPCKVPCSRCLGVSVYSSALQEVQRRILVDDFFVRCTAGGGPRCCRS